MIVILCTKDDDYSTNIIEWLNFLNCDYKIVDLNVEKFINCEIVIKNLEINIKIQLLDDIILDFNKISFFIYRSGLFNKEHLKPDFSNFFDPDIAEQYFNFENESLIDFIYDEIMEKSIGWLNQKPLNKLKQLKTAINVGLNIPSTYIVKSKKQLQNLGISQDLITKAIQENVGVQNSENLFYQRVELINLNDLPENFHSSLFQEKIIKDIEIRIFYLDNIFYSIAILNKDETVDMRDHYANNEYFKIELPIKLKVKLNKLMNRLNLISGSIDMILSSNGKFYFLEVNPEGQFDWVSKFGGYNLDEIIANFLNSHELNYLKKTN